MRSLLKTFKYMLSPCTKALSMVVEFHSDSITGIVCVVNSADKHMKEHCFPRDWPMKPSRPWWILPRESKNMMYIMFLPWIFCQRRTSSGSGILCALESLSSLYMDDVMPTHRQTDKRKI